MSWKQPFADLCQKNFTDQAKWWLNGFWEEGAKDYAETIWNITNMFIELGSGQKILYGKRSVEIVEKADLDEFQAHQALEKLGETLTVRELRTRLKGLDIDNNNRLSLSEYLLDKYKKTPEQLVNSPQGGLDPRVLAEAQAKLDDAQHALDKALHDADAAAEALQASKAAAAAAAKALESAEAKAAESAAALKKQEDAEALVRKAEAELQAAVDDLNHQEETYKHKIEELTQKSEDPNLGTVAKGKAKNELEQLKGEDPLPLRKAKITQEAALKKVAKEREKAEDATAASKKIKDESDQAAAASAEAKIKADEAAAASEKAKEAAEAAKQAAAGAFEEAAQALQDIKSKGTGNPNGALWWMDRILSEKKKYLPK